MTVLQRPALRSGLLQRRVCVRSRATDPGDNLKGTGSEMGWIQSWKQAVVGTVVGMHWICLSAFPDVSQAVLNAPTASLPRTADAALRRSIPSFNTDVLQIQRLMENISLALRIPQRKPWKSMQEKVESAKILLQDRVRLLEGVPEMKRNEGEGLIDDIATSLGRLELRIDEQDADKVSIRVADVLASISDLKLLQTSGLPYLIPKAYNGRPRLIGRATVQLQLDIQDSFNGSEGSSGSDVVEIVLDGYSAPLSAGAFASNVLSHSFDRQILAVDRDSIVLHTTDERNPKSLPLEILPEGQFEPLYRTELEVQTGEVPVLPMSIFGSVSLSHAVDEDEMSSSTEAFIFKFNRATAGLGGMAFDEGRFSVVGYVTQGIETVKRLQTGDRIISADIVKGRENLIQPDAGAPQPGTSQM